METSRSVVRSRKPSRSELASDPGASIPAALGRRQEPWGRGISESRARAARALRIRSLSSEGRIDLNGEATLASGASSDLAVVECGRHPAQLGLLPPEEERRERPPTTSPARQRPRATRPCPQLDARRSAAPLPSDQWRGSERRASRLPIDGWRHLSERRLVTWPRVGSRHGASRWAGVRHRG